MNTLFRFRNLAWIMILPVLLLACSTQAAQPTSQPIHYTTTPPQPTPQPVQFREIPVADVSIQIGVGSPIPVNAFVSGSWPDLCAQLAEVHQEIKDSTVEIRLLATPKSEACPPDMLGLPFGMAIPFNMVEMPLGVYKVIVNGVSTTFEWNPAALPPVGETTVPAKPPLMTATPSYEVAVYRDESAGFEFDYPASWTLDETGKVGDRGYVSQLTSWPHAPGDISAETPSGGTRMDVTIYTWVPKNDLDAFVEVRKQAWDASGISIQSQERWGAGDGQRLILFQVLGTDQKEAALFLFTTVGDRYLALSGSGDIKLLEEIFRTIRFD